MAQGETPLLPTVIGPHNIRRQHFFMLWWVLLCDYCRYFFHLPKTSELGRAINAHIIVAAYYNDHCLLFRVCSFVELSSAFVITAPKGATVVYTNTSVIFFFRVTSHEHGACPPRLYTVVYFFCTTLRRSGPTGSFFLQRIAPNDPTIALPYNNILSRRNIDGFWLYICS
jgi:hypothetical protein